MKIVIVGPGAMGCLIAALLKNRTKEDVWLLDHTTDRARRIREEGIRVEGISGTFTVKVPATTIPGEIGRADLVVMAVKSYSTEEAAKEIKELVADDTYVLTLQNGIGNVQILDDYFGPEWIIAGSTNHGATALGPAAVRHAGRGDTVIGRPDGKLTGVLRDIAHTFGKAGLETKITKDIDSVIWSKLVINAGINAITALTHIHNGMILEYEESRELLRSVVQEAVKVVKRKRIKLAYDDPIQKVESVCKATAANVSSMLQDVLNKKRTEIDFINGAIVRQAKSFGIPTPANETLARLVKTIEASYERVV